MNHPSKQTWFLSTTTLMVCAALSGCGDHHVVTIPGKEGDDPGLREPMDMGMPGGERDMVGPAPTDMGQVIADMGSLPSPEDMGLEPGPMIDMSIEDMGQAFDMAMMDPDDVHIGTVCNANGQMGSCQRAAQCPSPNQHVPGFCPGSSAVRCCVEAGDDPPDQGMMGTTECDEDAAPTPNALVAEDAPIGFCPDGMTQISANYCIDRFEASLVEVTANGDIPHSPFVNPGTANVRAVSVEGAIPQGYITGDQAEAACQNSGKRLCTSSEWLLACQGSQMRTYPYGNTEQVGVCNAARARHPVIEYFGTSEDWIWSELGNACINQLPDSLAKTGEHTGCVTPEGAYDMVGNLHEWVADASGTFRGGFYVDTYRNGNGCYYRTTAHNRQHWDYSTGFRCCVDALAP